jgi:hypothetical protein
LIFSGPAFKQSQADSVIDNALGRLIKGAGAPAGLDELDVVEMMIDFEGRTGKGLPAHVFDGLDMGNWQDLTWDQAEQRMKELYDTYGIDDTADTPQHDRSPFGVLASRLLPPYSMPKQYAGPKDVRRAIKWTRKHPEQWEDLEEALPWSEGLDADMPEILSDLHTLPVEDALAVVLPRLNLKQAKHKAYHVDPEGVSNPEQDVAVTHPQPELPKDGPPSEQPQEPIKLDDPDDLSQMSGYYAHFDDPKKWLGEVYGKGEVSDMTSKQSELSHNLRAITKAAATRPEWATLGALQRLPRGRSLADSVARLTPYQTRLLRLATRSAADRPGPVPPQLPNPSLIGIGRMGGRAAASIGWQDLLDRLQGMYEGIQARRKRPRLPRDSYARTQLPQKLGLPSGASKQELLSAIRRRSAPTPTREVTPVYDWLATTGQNIADAPYAIQDVMRGAESIRRTAESVEEDYAKASAMDPALVSHLQGKYTGSDARQVPSTGFAMSFGSELQDRKALLRHLRDKYTWSNWPQLTGRAPYSQELKDRMSRAIQSGLSGVQPLLRPPSEKLPATTLGVVKTIPNAVKEWLGSLDI